MASVSNRSAIVVAHPGHELRVYHWMERERPLYFCLTEGSGGAAKSRMASTHRVLEAVGATPGGLYGRYADKDLYRLLVDGHIDEFLQLVHELADALIASGVDCVAGDAVEGFNPTHDVCRFVIDGAVDIARKRTGRAIQNLDFVLDGTPDACPDTIRGDATWLRLDAAALNRKIDSALQYAELRHEVEVAIQRFGRGAFAVECLRPATTHLMIEQFRQELPAYERYGQIRVTEGRYQQIIRYMEHVLPVRHAIEAAQWS
jgi:AcrR family transcriptional regulator